MREIVLDTETTGLDPNSGHRVVEIGGIEIVNFMPTGKKFHEHLNPERAMPDEARAIHGLSDEFLAAKPRFADVVERFVEFVDGARLVIHNAQFDMGFLNAELVRLGRIKLANEFVDTVGMARRKFPGAPASLDALCKRFNIDNSQRTFHGALLDAQLLAEVYMELSGGRQPGFELASQRAFAGDGLTPTAGGAIHPPRPHAALPAELAAHEAFIATIKDALWLKV
ncbi:MAG: DNA polymerase III subunit epsilon [Rhodospirillales bacterium]